jgi:hypothetical protein
MKLIELTQDKFTQVDDSDFDYLNQWNWFAKKDGKKFYAARNHYENKKCKIILMHCVLMNDKGIDHIDGDGLNNQKFNLRKANGSQNRANTPKIAGCSSVYKGVYWKKTNNKWASRIRFNNKEIYLGLFNNEVDAALAYNNKARELFGEFAQINLTCPKCKYSIGTTVLSCTHESQ